MPPHSSRKNRQRKLPKIISREDAARLVCAPNIKAPTGLRNRVALQFMYRCGLRVSEVANLTLEDVLLDEGVLLVREGKGQVDRNLPMDYETIDWARKWALIRPQSEWFLCTLRGGKLSPRYLRAMVGRMSIRAGVYMRKQGGLKPVHPHTLRHCFCTERLEDGFSIVEVQQLAGHSSITTTQIYTHVRPIVLRDKMRKLTPLGDKQ